MIGTRELPHWLAWRLLEILLDRLADDAFLSLPSPLQAATLREQLAPLLDLEVTGPVADALQPALDQRGPRCIDALATGAIQLVVQISR